MKLKQLAAGVLSAALVFTSIPAVPVWADGEPTGEVEVSTAADFLTALDATGVTKITIADGVQDGLSISGTKKQIDADDDTHVADGQVIRTNNITIDLNGKTLDMGTNKLIFGSGERSASGGNYVLTSSAEGGKLTGSALYTLGYSETAGVDFSATIDSNVTIENENSTSKVTAPVMFTYNNAPTSSMTLTLNGTVSKNSVNTTSGSENTQFIYDEWGTAAKQKVTVSSGSIKCGDKTTVTITGKTITMSRMTENATTFVAYEAESSDQYSDFTFNISTPAPPSPQPQPDPDPDPSPDPDPKPSPTPDPEPASDIDPTADPSTGKTPQGEPTVVEEGGVKTTTQENTDGSKTVIVEETGSKTVTVEEKDGTIKEQTHTEDASTGYITDSASVKKPDGSSESKAITKAPDGTKIEESNETAANGDFINKKTETDAKGNVVSEETSSQVTDEKAGTITKTEDSLDSEGNTTEFDRVEKTDGTGDFEQAYVEKDKDGKVTKSETSKQTTDPTTKVVTTSYEVTDANGSTVSTSVSYPNGDYESSEVKKDAKGDVIESTTDIKKTEANGDFVQKKEVKDGSGAVLESKESSQKTDATTGNVVNKESTVNRDGTSVSKEVVKDKTGGVSSVQLEQISGNEKSTATFEGDGSKKSVILTNAMTTPIVKSNEKNAGEATICDVPAVVTGFGNEAWPVVGIGTEAFVGNTFTQINIPDSIASIGEEAFENNGATEIYLAGKITKNMFGKNAFKGNGTKAKGKGLTFYVASKKDMKQLKKALKKTGVPKAKIKVSK